MYRILQFLSSTKYAKTLCFIGGTSLRLVYGINRFSEDLDFDVKNMTRKSFNEMTNSIIDFLNKWGLKTKAEDKEKDLKLKAYRRNIVFPNFMQEHGLSAIKSEKFLIKIECQDQKVYYQPQAVWINGCGCFFNFMAPPQNVLCAMKISALLSRKKGRDFYDTLFLLSKTMPDYKFLKKKQNIANGSELKAKLLSIARETNLSLKAKDFQHLVFEPESTNKILLFKNFIEQFNFG